MAVAEVEINGKKSELMAVSGAFDSKGSDGVATLPNYSDRLFDPKRAVGNDGKAYMRDSDTEFKILEAAARQLNPNAVKGGKHTSYSGVINIFSEKAGCASCNNAAKQYKKIFKGVKVNIIEVGTKPKG